MSWMPKLNVLDTFAKSKDEVQVRTLCGAAVTAISGLLIVILLISETGLWLSTTEEHRLLVDHTRQEAMEIQIDIAFFATKCKSLNVRIGDTRGAPYAASSMDVHKKPFVPPQLMAKEPGKTWGKDDVPGCIMTGKLNVRKMAGVIQFRAGVDRPRGLHMMSGVNTPALPAGNFSHHIRQLVLGPLIPGYASPLDGKIQGIGYKGESDNGKQHYQYFMKVVPTEYTYIGGSKVHTYQYSSTEFAAPAEGMAVSGLDLKIDFSPTLVAISEQRRTFLQFLTSLCAIIGGVFTVAGMVDSFAYKSSQMLKKND